MLLLGKSSTSIPEDLVCFLARGGRQGRECVITVGRSDKDAHSESWVVVTELCRDPVQGVVLDSCG